MPAPISYFFWRVHSWPRRVDATIAVIALLLLAGRVTLSFVAKRLRNDRLQRIPNYTGQIDDIGIHLWRGAYSLHGVGIFRKYGKVREPFFQAKRIYISLAWRELWHRKIVSNIYVDEGQLHFVKGPSAEESQTDLDNRWQNVFQDIAPIDITNLVITDGLLRYIDTTPKPTVDLFVTHMRATSSPTVVTTMSP